MGLARIGSMRFRARAGTYNMSVIVEPQTSSLFLDASKQFTVMVEVGTSYRAGMVLGTWSFSITRVQCVGLCNLQRKP